MGKSYHILLLEEGDHGAKAIRRELDRLDLDLRIEAAVGLDALEGRLEDDPPDLLLFDQTGPSATLGEVLQRLRDRHPRLPLIVVSGEDGDEAADIMLQGASDCVGMGNLARLGPAVRRELLRRRRQVRAERQRDKAYEIADIGHWELDLDRDRLFWSEMIRDLHEVGPQYEPELESALQFYKEGTHRETVREAVERAIETGESFDVESKLITAKGTERWVRAVGETEMRDGECVRIYGSTQDITQRKSVEEKLRGVVEHSTNLFYRHDPDHKLTYLSPQAEWFLGCSPEEAMRRWTDFATDHPVNEKALRHTRRAIETGEAQPSYELQLEKVDGERIWVQVHEAPIVENGETVAIVGSLTDITERKEIENRNRLQQEVSQFFNARDELDDILERVLRHLAEFGRFNAAELWLVDARNTHLKLSSAVSRGEKGEIFARQSSSVDRFDPGEGLPGTVWESEDPGLWENLPEHSDFVRRSAAAEAGLQTAIGIPIRHNEQGVGVLLLAGDRERFGRNIDVYRVLQDYLGAEIRRKQQEEEMQLLFESAPEIIAIAGPDDRFVRVNPAFCEMMGYSEEELTTTPFEEFIHPEDLKDTRKEYEETITGERQAENFVNRWRTKDGSYRWISWSSSDVYNKDGYVFSFGRDVTALREAERRSAQTLERIGDAFFAVDDDWIVTYWNREAERVLQKPKEEIIGKHLWTEYEDAVDLEFYTQYHKAVEEQETVHFEEFYPPLEIWFEVSAYPSDTGLSVYFRDITERKNYEESLKELNRELEEHAEELARSNNEKETLLMEIHHRVKNNLAVVSGMMQLQAFNEENERLGRKLMDSVSRIKAMASIHDLLYRSKSYSRLNLGDNIRKLVSDLVETFHGNAEIDVRFELEPVNLNINQAIPCSLVVNEVVTNALKHAFEEGRFGSVQVEISEKKERVFLRVEDNGRGMPDDFEAGDINSLGMRLINTLAAQLEADYSYNSMEQGTRFTMEFEKAEVRGVGSSHLF